MRHRPSSLLRTMGILSIIFGSLGLLCGLGGAAIHAANHLVVGQPGAQFSDFMNRQVPGWSVLSAVQGRPDDPPELPLDRRRRGIAPGAPLGLVHGASLRKRQYPPVPLLVPKQCHEQVGYVVFQLVWVVPAVQAWNRQLVGANAQAREAGAVIGLVAAAAVKVIYAAALFNCDAVTSSRR